MWRGAHRLGACRRDVHWRAAHWRAVHRRAARCLKQGIDGGMPSSGYQNLSSHVNSERAPAKKDLCEHTPRARAPRCARRRQNRGPKKEKRI
eukprot:5264359-Pleurochrysis_carterae.AAC.2